MEILKVDDVAYTTLLTKKFRERKKYEPNDPKKVTAFIPGTIVGVSIKKGSKVNANDKLIALEAMKMVNQVATPMDGVVKKVYVKVGDIVAKNQLLLELE
ncbi:MAG: acetyl-CoA carboxylase biotin carboxyl carrier protein subunit [Bacteroidetes bacterium]|nr:MAG: acetyl-CoA carboxylase biotin carboxyl carrier protein subunit [Bacteroidota bacterium]